MAVKLPPKLYCADTGKLFPFPVTSLRIADESVEEASCRVFKVGDISSLVDLKDLCCRFGLEWCFVTRRSGVYISSNRASRSSSYVKSGVRKSTSITCGCDWSIRFRGFDRKKSIIQIR